MTEEQRWKQQYQIELDRNKCLKGIWDELKDLKNLKKVEMGASPENQQLKDDNYILKLNADEVPYSGLGINTKNVYITFDNHINNFKEDDTE